MTKTAVYIDGYNLYYGRLRQSAFKWLDVVDLTTEIIKIQSPDSQIAVVKYFTAPALARFATHGHDSVTAQEHYHRALKVRHDNLQIIYGTHSIDLSGTLLPEFREGEVFSKQNRVRVWKLEEKKTDVNIAIHMYRDAVRADFDQLVIVSNDSDAEPVLRAIREEFPEKVLGVITPIAPRPADGKGHRSVSSSLAEHADWTRKHLLDDELIRAQMPSKVPTKKRPIFKPDHW